MSTELLEGDVMLTRFYGGEKRGLCYQIMTTYDWQSRGNYVQLTDAEMAEVVVAYVKSKATGRL